jgi:uncharacterized protein (DUF1501 family)
VVLDGWDTHKDNFARTKKLMGALDPGVATLVKDLEDRKMLANTLVVMMGDFGRTPKINGNDGRDHYPQAWSAMLAGGGIKGGVAYGSTDANGEKVVGDKTHVPDLLATVATLAGMDPGHTQTSPIGRPISLTDGGQPIKAIMA